MSNALATALRDSFSARAGDIVIRAQQRDLTGEQLNILVDARRMMLAAFGTGRGDVVLVAGGRDFDFWIDTLALWCLGAIAVPVDPDATPTLLEHCIAATRPVAHCGGETLPRALHERIEALLPAEPHSHNVDLEDVALILFTSGTTGLPKAVPLGAQALLENARATISATGLADCRHLFAPVPFRFISGVSHFLATTLAGVLFQGTEARFVQADLVDAVAASGADSFGGSPIHARWLAQSQATTKISLSWFMSSGDHLPDDVAAALRERFPDLQLQKAYGLTELAGRFCIQGRPIAGLQLSESDGHIVASGPLVFAGYLDSQGVRSGLRDDASFDTGDIGRIENGAVILEGRADDVFKSAGLKVSTQPVSDALMAIGIFADVAVVSVPHEILGQVPGVVYVLAPDCVFKKGEVMRALRKSLPSSHLPQRFVVAPRIQRTGSGKVMRQVAREILRNAP